VRLLDLVQVKQFRLDFCYRLAIFPIAVPPLRNGTEDIRALAEHFLENYPQTEVPARHLTATALQSLQKAAWARNVRELQHAIERAFILAGNDLRLTPEHFQPIGASSLLREI